jgi:hypothetical protein
MFIRIKKVKNKDYFYLVKNEWQDGTCRQKVIKYLGRERPTPQVLAEILKHSA